MSEAQWVPLDRVTKVYYIKDGRELAARAEVTFDKGKVDSIILDYGVASQKVKISGPRPLELLKKLLDFLEKEVKL